MNTVFGLTTTHSDGSATISDINFYTRDSLVTCYPEMQQYLGAPDNVEAIPSPQDESIFTLHGVQVSEKNDSHELPKGVYIVNKKKRIY